MASHCAGKDDGQPCANHDEMNCPAPPRCAVRHPDSKAGSDYNDWECSGAAGGSGGQCVDASCRDLYDADSCSGGPQGCAWSDSCYACYNASETYPCDMCYGQTGCPQEHCQWLPSPTGCGADEDGQAGACVNQGASTVPPCNSFDVTTSECCPDHCTWDSDTAACDEPGFIKACESFGSHTKECPTDRCAVSLGICHTRGTALTCSDICNEFLCSASGSCNWDKSGAGSSDGDQPGRCLEGGGTLDVCTGLSLDDCYAKQHCAVQGTTCVDGVCSDIWSAEVCGAWSEAPHNCVWHGDTGCFFANEELPCDMYFDADMCPTDRCHYDASCFTCLDMGDDCPCHLFYQEDDCPSARCSWTATAGDGASCELVSTDADPPALDGNGNHDASGCTADLTAKYRPALDAAMEDCHQDGDEDNAPVTAVALKCLDYYIKAAPANGNFAEACPCLWFWAQHEQPARAWWMALDC